MQLSHLVCCAWDKERYHNIFITIPLHYYCILYNFYLNSHAFTNLLSLRLMTFNFCISPISSGRNSSLLECRNNTVTCFQFPIWKKPQKTKRKELIILTLNMQNFTVLNQLVLHLFLPVEYNYIYSYILNLLLVSIH